MITQPSDTRLIVDAGPGTGKTAVACARVAHLINEGELAPRSIWLISFTRTAVKEIRDRIRSYLHDPDALYGVKIATIDAHAWSIHQGFAPNAVLTGSFDDNIARVLELVDSDDEVRDYIEETSHLIVDEAQDLVGIRADLIVRLVERLRPDSGVTVFADEAQAIYGFAGDAEEERATTAVDDSLTTRLIALGGFSRAALEVVHRTKSPGLLKIFTGVRAMVVAPGEDPATRLAQVREAVAIHADNHTGKNFDPDDPVSDGVFVLFRRRSEVLQASSFLCQRQVAHRLRMSGLPSIIPPWLGAVLGDFTQLVLTREEFLARCTDIAVAGSRPPDAERAWSVLESLARGQRDGSVELRRLRNLLGRTQPPTDIASPDYGTAGPILGTIHAAKGRETDDVWMMLPTMTSEDPDPDVDLDEETRVVFVGATRARRTLTVGRGYRRLVASNLEGSGRVYALQYKAGMVRVELGRSGDIGASSVASRLAIGSAKEVHELQRRLALFDGVALPVRADCDRASNFIYRISEAAGGGGSWGAFSQSLNSDLFKVGEAVRVRHGGGRRRPPDYFQHLYLTGARTIVLRPDDPELEQLHEPWRTSGILLAPMVHGFVTTFFPFRR